MLHLKSVLLAVAVVLVLVNFVSCDEKKYAKGKSSVKKHETSKKSRKTTENHEKLHENHKPKLDLKKAVHHSTESKAKSHKGLELKLDLKKAAHQSIESKEKPSVKRHETSKKSSKTTENHGKPSGKKNEVSKKSRKTTEKHAKPSSKKVKDESSKKSSHKETNDKPIVKKLKSETSTKGVHHKNPILMLDKQKPEKKSPLPDLPFFSYDEKEESGSGDEGNKCNKPLDLVIALDSSESVREANWTKLIRFTKALMKSVDPSLTRVGVIRYNTKAEVPIPLGFFQSSESFSAALDSVFYEPGGTRTDVALSKALLIFASAGQRRASKVLVVVTDNPTNDIRISKDNLVVGKQLVEKSSKFLKNYEVITFGVGVKYGLTETEMKDLNEELKMITQDEEGEKRLVEVTNFDELLSSVNDVAGKICLVNGGWSKWSPWSECTASCGGGTRVRIRDCDNPKPVNNGTKCTEFGGSSVETSTCSIFPCEDCPNGFDYIYVDNNQLSASSIYTRNTGDSSIMQFHSPKNGKLYNIMNAGAWCAEHSAATENRQDQYIQMDLKIPVKIAKVGTQGQASAFANNWVMSYKFNYSEDGRTWKQYNKILDGNKDTLSVQENLITPPVLARYIRFNPIHWNVQNGGVRNHDICMRVGVFKCTEVKKLNKRRKKIKRALTQPRKYQMPF